MKSAFDELYEQIQLCRGYSEEQKGDDLHDFMQAKNQINVWKAHLLRSANQEAAKQDVIKNLDSSSALVVTDWAMKFVQMKCS